MTFDFGATLLDDYLIIESADEPEWPRMIMEESIPQWQKRREEGETPKVTMKYKVYGINSNGDIIERVSDGAL